MRGLLHPWHRHLGAAALVAILTAAAPAYADGRAEIEKARAAYLARNWTDAEERARALLDPTTGVKERSLASQARMLLAASLIAQGKREPATQELETLILEDPNFEPDPLSFPGDVVNAFIDTRAQLAERIKTAAANAARLDAERRAKEAKEREQKERWLAKLKEQAGEERITVRNNRVTAFLPFGVGQFQNGQTALGWTFLGVESALVVASAITVPMYSYARGRAADEIKTGDIDKKSDLYKARADDIFAANLAFAGSFVIVAAIGIVQANVAFVPEKVEIKRRELPPMAKASSPKLAPVVAPIFGPAGAGAFVGVRAVAF